MKRNKLLVEYLRKLLEFLQSWSKLLVWWGIPVLIGWMFGDQNINVDYVMLALVIAAAIVSFVSLIVPCREVPDAG